MEGQESVKYGTQKNRRFETDVFCTIPLVDAFKPDQVARGRGLLTVPEDAMHTLHEGDYDITWRIVVQTEVPKWPDIKEQYEIRVKP
jgi:hypothetical protein